MGSTLSVTHLRGLTSGNNANQILLDSGHDLHAPGHVIQTVSAEFSDLQTYTNSTSLVNTTLTGTITPKFSTSKILVTISTQGHTSSSGDYGLYGLKRGTTNLKSGRSFAAQANNDWETISFSYLDSPATTSATTYTLTMKSYAGSNYVYHGWGTSTGGSVQSIILQEIAQ